MAVINSLLWSPSNDINGTFCGNPVDGSNIPFNDKATAYMFRDENGFVIPRAAITNINGLDTNVVDCPWKATRYFGPFGTSVEACNSLDNLQLLSKSPSVNILYIFDSSATGQRPGTGQPGDLMWFNGKDIFSMRETQVLPFAPQNAMPLGHYIIWPRLGIDHAGDIWQLAYFNGASQFPIAIGAQGQGC